MKKQSSLLIFMLLSPLCRKWIPSLLQIQRLIRESKILLRQSTLNSSKIAYALGFREVPHFNHFFKKHTGTSPLKVRKGLAG
jgi:AraC-like DNA-binding protein